MKSNPNCCHTQTIYIIYISLMMFASIQLCKGSSMEEGGNERILSRRRRYLIFPEGSSLQIVYDTYHPVVDYTNLLVVGITGALAWELPSKPVYLEEELQEIYKNGSLPLLRRNDDNVELNQFQDEHISVNRKLRPQNLSKLSVYNGNNKLQHYLSYVNNPLKEASANKKISNHLSKERFHAKKKSIFFPYFETQHQAIHPTFRKRNASNNITQRTEKIFNLKLHRRSRHKLYKRLEKFIDTTGHDGRDCILKALCQAGQNKQDDKPRSFLGEILTAIFSIPDLPIIRENLSDELYDVAHREKSDCTEKFPKCSQNIWKSFH